MRKVSLLGIFLLIVGLVIGILGIIGVCLNFINHNFGFEAWLPMAAAFCGILLAGITYMNMKD